MNYQWLLFGIAVLAPFLGYAAWRRFAQTDGRRKPAAAAAQESSEPALAGAQARPQPMFAADSEPSLSRSPAPLSYPHPEPPPPQPAAPDPEPVRSVAPDLSPAAPDLSPVQSAGPDLSPAAAHVSAQPTSPPFAPAAAGDLAQAEENAPAEQDADGFPELKGSDLPEQFCYTARLVCPPPGFEAMQLREMSADIIRQVRLQKHQFLLGWGASGQWQSLRSDGRYPYAVWAVPLCAGASALADHELSAIVRCVQTWMRRAGGRALLPPLPEVAERISQVQEFVRQCDMVIRTNLVAFKEDNAQPRSCGEILEIAFAHGMEEVDGRIEKRVNSETVYVMRGGNGDDLGSKSPDRKLTKLYLELDVPRVTRPRKSCEDMFEFAGKLGRVLGFRLVDDAGGTVPEEHIAGCLEGIEDIAATLREHGIKPGSKVARALFS